MFLSVDKNHRFDIVSNKDKIIYDVTVPHPYSARNIVAAKKEVGGSMSVAVVAKVKEMGAMCTSNGFRFVPLPFDKLGAIGKEVHALIAKCSDRSTGWDPHARHLNFAARTFKNYWTQIISCRLQCSIAGSVLRLVEKEGHGQGFVQEVQVNASDVLNLEIMNLMVMNGPWIKSSESSISNAAMGGQSTCTFIRLSK